MSRFIGNDAGSMFLLQITECRDKNDSFCQGLWIRIRIGSGFSDFVDPDPYWEFGSGSRGKKIEKLQWKKIPFLVMFQRNFTPKKGIQ
jgi:hypothetical protein